MAITIKTAAEAKTNLTEAEVESNRKELGLQMVSEYHELRSIGTELITTKKALDRINFQPDAAAEDLNALRQKLNLDDCTSRRDVYIATEGVVDDYAKKVATFAQSMISTFRKYNFSLFDLVLKKLRVNKAIDTSKFVQIDTSMRMVVMKYEDYVELGEGAGARSADMSSEVAGWFSYLNSIKSLFADGKSDEARVKLGEFVKAVSSSVLVTYLKDHKLVDFVVDNAGEQVDGSTGLVKANPSKRFNELEQSYLLSEAGWTDVDKVKNAYVLKNAEEVSANINKLYKTAIDFMDEARRISADSCTKEPYICVSLIKYASLIAQMINIYVKSYDVCWTTCLRVCQACMVEQK